MKHFILILFAAVSFLSFVGPVYGVPVDVYFVDGPQDPLFIPTHVHELGDQPPFPDNEWITSAFSLDEIQSCFDPNNFDDPSIINTIVTMTNMTGIDWYDVWYVADPETTLSNFDGFIGNFGLGDAEEAFQIDSIGVNRPLIFESILADNIFQAGETWQFIIQDFVNALGGPATPFDSIGIASLSTGWPPSTGSILATPIPEPASLFFFGFGLLGLAKFKRKST